MNKLIVSAVIIFLCAGCAGKREVDRDIAIQIAFAQTWKVELKKDTFTKFYVSRPPLGIKLDLTDAEKTRIIDAWYSLRLDQLTGESTLSDNCHTMPKLNTVIQAKTVTHSQQITIDENCGDFYFFTTGKADRVKKFIKLVRDIVFSRPAVKNAPESDVMYM